MIKQIYVSQDLVSRQWAQPFVGDNDEQAARDMRCAMAAQIVQGNFLVRDAVVLAVACVDQTEDAYKIIPYDVPRRVCAGTDVEVTEIAERLRALAPVIPTADEDEVTVDA